MITDRNGNLIKSYHKKNLYKDDKKWCTPGDNFEYIDIETNCGKTARLALGICLDYYYSSQVFKFNSFQKLQFLLKNFISCYPRIY